MLGNAMGSAGVSWGVGVGPSEAVFDLRLFASLQGATAAQVGLGEVIVTFTGVGAPTLPVRYSADFGMTTGASSLVLADIGNNGTFDWQGGTGIPLAGTVGDLVAQPLQIRFQFNFSSFDQGTAATNLTLRVVPDYGIHILPIAANCGLSNRFAVRPLFDPALGEIVTQSDFSAWHVIGFQAQPTLLPPSLTMTGAPCLVVPSPDLVLRTGSWFLPIPAAVRPITLHAQLIDVVGGVRVSDAYLVSAF